MTLQVSCKWLFCVFAISLAWSSAVGKGSKEKAPLAGEPHEYSLQIASQPLSDALQEFSRQSGVQVVFFSGLTDGLRSPAVVGKYTLAEALRSLLVNSKLTFRSININTVQIEQPAPAPTKNSEGAAPPASNPTAPRNGGGLNPAKTAPNPSIEELVVTGTAEGLVATRTETPLRDIPQTISIISREQMRQQNDTDLADALAHATGITTVRADSLDEQFFSRGYQITSFHVDGGAALTSMIYSQVLFLGTPDLSEYDHIEVLRGADALFGGIGNPGGTINLLRKHPLGTEELDFSGWVGSWNNKRAELDLSGPLGFDGALRGRIDGVYEDRDYFYDIASLKRRRIFAALEADVTPSTLLTLGGSYQSDNAVPIVEGVPLYYDDSDSHLPRTTALGFDWAFYKTRLREFYLQLRHEFAPGWRLKLDTSVWNESADYGYGQFGWPLELVTNGTPQGPSAYFTLRPNTEQQIALDLTINGAFDWFGHREEAAFGGDFTRLVDSVAESDFAGFGAPLANAFTYNPAAYPDPRPGGISSLDEQISSTYRQSGAYASMRVYFNDDWSIVGGARIGSNRTFSRVGLFSPILAAHFDQSYELGDSALVTPYAGLTYHVDSHYTLYASYADIDATMAAAQLPDGKLLGAAQGVDYEVGTKGVWQEGAVNGSVVLYKVDQRNVPVIDPTSAQGASFCCFLQGTNRSRGVDVEFSGKLTPDWLLAAGYTFNINQAATGGELSSVTPRHLLKVWTSKELPGALNHWALGATLHAQSSQWQASPCAAYNLIGVCPVEGAPPVHSVQGGFAVADLRASYRIAPHWQVALTVSNVFDRIYFQTLGPNAQNNWYGEPRAVTVRVDAKY